MSTKVLIILKIKTESLGEHVLKEYYMTTRLAQLHVYLLVHIIRIHSNLSNIIIKEVLLR